MSYEYMQLKKVLDVTELLRRFPRGFAVTPSGRVMEIVHNFQEPQQAISIQAPREDKNAWGFVVVAVPLVQQGDQESFEKKRIPTQDFFKAYEQQIWSDETEIKQVVKNLNEIGVGVDYHYTVSYRPKGDTFRLVLEELELERELGSRK